MQPCRAPPTAVSELPCGHRFHSVCIGEWLQRQTRCPLCRRAVYGMGRVLEIVF
eukprot:SAG11_NODE_503_length_8890_cov_30.658628_2_plen_54_part_00